MSLVNFNYLLITSLHNVLDNFSTDNFNFSTFQLSQLEFNSNTINSQSFNTTFYIILLHNSLHFKVPESSQRVNPITILVSSIKSPFIKMQVPIQNVRLSL